MFLGIAIVSDLFMESIEEITAQTTLVVETDDFGKETIVEKTVWNATVANLTLMALGSSAPEIMLAVLETIMQLEDEPGELGPNTIVGSAAFNLLIITAISIISVDEIKKVDIYLVFIITYIFSVLAYIWMLVVLVWWSPGEVTIAESLLTLVWMGVMLIIAYGADKFTEWRNKNTGQSKTAEEMEEEDADNLRKEAKAFLRYKAKENGKGYVIDCMKGGINALKASPEEKEEIRKMYKLALGVDSLDGVDIMEYMQVLEPESLIERLEHRKAASLKGDKKFVKMKGTQMQEEKEVQDLGNLNTKIGFKSTMYSVTESSGYIEITIIKKVAEEMAFMVKTVDDTATAPDDYEALERIVTMSKNEKEHKIQIQIIDDDIWEPDKDFLVQICNEEGVRKEGSDTQCKVTILDEDNPGVIGFESRNIKVRKMDKFAYVRVVRQDGSDGDVKCMVSTRAEEDSPNAAREFEDFLPEERVLYFKHQEQEQTVQI